MMYDQVPKFWTTGNQEDLQRTLKILDSFVSYYEKKVEAELAIAERRRPGITQNLAMGADTDKNLVSPLMAMVRSFANAVDSRDRFMRGHSEKVARIAVLIGRRINMNETDIENLEMASLLHDIGKLSVPEAVLTKTQPLTSDEWKLIQKHPYFGAQIVKPMGMLGKIVPWIYHHQERWDGTGYPDRLSKADIPMGASIISLAEAYTAMSTDMPNRESLPEEEIKNRVKQESGKQFHPEIVDAFLDIKKDEAS